MRTIEINHFNINPLINIPITFAISTGVDFSGFECAFTVADGTGFSGLYLCHIMLRIVIPNQYINFLNHHIRL